MAKSVRNATETQTTYDKLDNVKKDVDAAKELKVNTENKNINEEDIGTGFNTDAKADELIELVRSILEVLQGKKVQKAEQLALPQGKEVQNTVKKSLGEIYKEAIASGLTPEQAHTKIADESNKRKGKSDQPGGPTINIPTPPKLLNGEPYKNKVEKSNIYASPVKTTIWDKFAKVIDNFTGATKEYENVIHADAEEQDRMAAERIKTWGMNNGRNPNDTGDIAGMRRILQLYRTNKSSIEKNPELAQKIRLTGGREVDTTAITKSLAKALSGKQMRNAQMGGSPLRQVFGSMTLFAGMPSIEKSRAQAEGLNQVLGNINQALQSVLSDIQRNETELAGMEKIGEVQFDDKGYVTKGSSAAYKTLADLEEHKVVLDSILADLNMVDQVVGQTDGKFSKLVKRLSFTSPVLRENNSILRNINAGLDKNGKALKFQTRMAEILNYTFQLIGRSIGQWFKKILSMLNPLNVIKTVFRTITGWIKSAFNDFASYDTKWQRTMNVIKINFQRAIKPAMQWIAQELVNVIGFLNIISMKVQEAFGQIPIDLFDQAGAQAEKIRRELEEATNVTAGFDELHDIGSDNSGANDLMGDIYKPELSQDWIDLANRIGDTFAGLIKGDLGFGEAMGKILGLTKEGLDKIWDMIKTTPIGKWIETNWKKLLDKLLKIFIAWQLLKIAGKLIWNALTANLTGDAFGSVLGKLGVKFKNIFTSTKFGSDFVRGIKDMFTSGGMIGTFKAGGASLGAVFAESLVAVLGVAIAGIAIGVGGDKMRKNTAYNAGIDSVGGDDKDKKSNTGAAIGTTLGTTAGLALTGLAIGGPIGAAIGAGIGAIAGLLTTVLAPAIEKAEIKARDMNNELQKIEYYEGQVQGAKTQTDLFDEQVKLLNESLKLNTEKVYEQGEKLGISKDRMDELVKATQDGTFTTSMLTGSEVQLSGSLTDLAQKQEHTTEVTKKLEEAQKKLLKAQTDLSIAQDVEAGNFELAAARIEVAEAQGVYATEEATSKRIQLYKQGSEEERKELLQDLTPEQRKKMLEYEGVTEKELAELAKIWNKSSTDTQNALLKGVDDQTIGKFKGQMSKIDEEIKSHQGFWQGVGDTLKEIFTFGHAETWTYNGEAKYYKEQNKIKIQKNAAGTNWVESDGLAFLHQGEAIIPKKYNQPYQPIDNSRLENAINQLNQQVAMIGNKVDQGIDVHGQFVQKGSDLVATVQKANNRLSNNVLNNKSFARY